MIDIQEILHHCSNLSVLYVEDDAHVREQTLEMMEGFFASVFVATNGQHGLELYDKIKQERGAYPDIIMTDIQMPRLGGLAMSEAILQVNPKQTIIVISAYSDTGNLLKLIELGINYFLPKPLHFRRLFEILHKVSTSINGEKMALGHAKELEMLNATLYETVNELQNSIAITKEATKAKDQFLANMSHEIRTPMNAIIGLSHILMNTPLSPKQHDYLQKIKNSGDLLLGIINDILDFSKIEAGKLDVEKIEFDINTTLENVSNMILGKAHEKGLDVIFNIDKSVPALIEGDPLRLGQVIINLMNNAVKFTPKGEIELRVRMLPLDGEKKILEFVVSDTGIGITPEQLSNLFHAFTQADNSMSRKYGGTGLGLTISKQLVELMGGQISVQSEFGKGTQFTFTIETKQKYLSSYRLPSKSLMSKKTLVVDSNPTLSSALKTMLGYFRYDVFVASNLNEAKTLIDEQHFDILCIERALLEQSAGQLDGRSKESKVVLIENSLELNDPKSIRGVKINAKLSKPFHQLMIFQLILELFEQQEHLMQTTQNNSFTVSDLESIEGARIIIAEDNAINQLVMKGLLEHSGLELLFANDGLESLALLESEKDIDLVLMDINMPNMDGYEAALEIRKKSHYDTLPIVALSANAMPADILKSYEHGMSAHITKPIEINTLYGTLLEYIPPKKKLEKIQKNGEMTEKSTIPDKVLDIEEGLSRVGNDAVLYSEIVYDLATKLTDSYDTLGQLLSKKSTKELASYLHGLKGNAGNISANQLYNTLLKLEIAIESGESGDILGRLGEYKKALDCFLQEFRTLLPDTPPSTQNELEDAQEDSDETIEVILTELAEQIKKRKAIQCKKLSVKLEKLPWPQEQSEDLGEIIKLIKHYRLNDALLIIKKLL